MLPRLTGGWNQQMEDEKLSEGGLGVVNIRMAFFAEAASQTVAEQKRRKEERERSRRAAEP